MTTTALPTEASSPDQAAELRCPLCDYDLRGLTQNRCPECGHAFDPAELRAADAARSRWLFEHAVPRRVLWAFVSTGIRTLRPFAFWRSVHASERIVPSRLMRWWLGWTAIAAACVTIAIGARTVISYRQDQFFYTRYCGSLSARMPGIQFVHDGGVTVVLMPNGVDSGIKIDEPSVMEELAKAVVRPRCGWMLAAVALWPLAAVIAFRAFGLTLRRAGIRNGHLWRCVLYAWPVVMLPGVALVIASLFVRVAVWRPYEWRNAFGQTVDAVVPLTVWQMTDVFHIGPAFAMALALAMLVSTVHLVAAHVRYLKLPHAIGQALLVQSLAWMLTMAAIALGSGALMQ